jgi:hypothetical protein
MIVRLNSWRALARNCSAIDVRDAKRAFHSQSHAHDVAIVCFWNRFAVAGTEGIFHHPHVETMKKRALQ